MIWFATIIIMIVIFAFCLENLAANFSKLAKTEIDLSGLPAVPKIDVVNIDEGIQKSKEIINDYISASNTQLRELGDKYIADNNILDDDGFSTLKFKDAKQKEGNIILTYEHYYKDVLVLDGGLILSVDPNKNISILRNGIKKGISLPVDPIISAKSASELATKKLDDGAYEFKEARLAIAGYDGKFYLVWKTTFARGENGDTKEILIGATHGNVIINELLAEDRAAINQTSNITQ
jgi:hypothetical protein